MTCSLEKSLFGLIVIIFLSESIVASKAISVPLELVSLRVIKLSTFESVNAESSVFLIASVKVMVMFESLATFAAALTGLKVRVGVIESMAVKVIELAVLAFPELSSTVAPMAT